MFGIESITSGAIKGVVESVANIADRFVTTSDEKNNFIAELKRIETEQAKAAADIANQAEKNITDRHAADMHSDSWLSKNIRPMVLVYLMVLFTLGFFRDVPKETLEILQSLLMTVFVFYFGARSLDKLTNKLIRK